MLRLREPENILRFYVAMPTPVFLRFCIAFKAFFRPGISMVDFAKASGYSSTLSDKPLNAFHGHRWIWMLSPKLS
jgi:hypothetical protein